MEQQFFIEGDRVALRRDLKPYRRGGSVIKAGPAGAVEQVNRNAAFVRSDGLNHAVFVALSDLDLLASNERFTLTIGYFPVEEGRPRV
jgi:hypothetical protein